jgi:hypothetical protein
MNNIDGERRELASRLAEARQQLAHVRAGSPPWSELDDTEKTDSIREAEHYIDAAHRAGIALAVINFRDVPPPRRVTANARGLDGRPLDRDEYAQRLSDQAIALPAADRLPVLAEGEAATVADLLDELAGIHSGEPLGRLARDLAHRIHDRLSM